MKGVQDTQDGPPPNDTSDPSSHEPTPEKVHVRGLDNLTTDDIKAFANEYFPAHRYERIEWIDDTSLNLVYENAEIAKGALQAFSASDAAELTSQQTIPTKPFPSHPDLILQVRLAVIGDRKVAGARDRSRFYLMNPEYDPAERRARGAPRGGNRYRDRDDGGYRSQRYDDREHQKRRREDESAGFDASLYDDDAAALARRSNRNNGRRSSSRSESRDRGDRRGQRVRFGSANGKELFPDRMPGASGRLRDRSASPIRDSEGDREMSESRDRRRDTAAAANRLKAQKIKEQLRVSGTASATKELFPHKVGVQHRRSGAFDAADETADLFAKQMKVSTMDGRMEEAVSAINIRGTAKASATYDFSIRGTAPGIKELFPERNNAGKELFATRLEGRGLRRQKAGDLFD